MKTHLLTLALFGFLIQNSSFAQDRTTVNATSAEISDNLDLRAVASIFGASKNLEDFERQINDPGNKISNLDLNFDRQVDYLRVIEAVEKNTHLIILQAVLEKDVFQDVATIEVERDRNNQVQIQVVGDVFMYGPNYIYEPVYVNRPVIYNVFWVHNYNPYYSPYYYNYYPTYYYAWTPYPIYRYRRNIHVHINEYNFYNYTDHRRSSRAVAMYETRRSDGYERNNPNQSFSTRNTATNRYALDQASNTGTRNNSIGTRDYTAHVPPSVRNTSESSNVRNNKTDRSSNAAVSSDNSLNGVRSGSEPSNVRNNKTDRSSNATVSSDNSLNGVRSGSEPSNVRNINTDRTSNAAIRSENNVNSTRSSGIQNSTNRNYTPEQPIRSVEQSRNTNMNASRSSNPTRVENSRTTGTATGNRSYSRN